MEKTYAILGAGMQGTAAAFDLSTFGDAKSIRLGDWDLEHAQRSADRVNRLVQRKVCTAHQVDALDPCSVARFLQDADALCSCVPYHMHPRIARVAMATKTPMADLGGNTDITLQTLQLDTEAKQAGISLVPDTGLAPGLVNSLALRAIESFDTTESIKLYCGVLPQHPVPPFNYKLTFNIEGLVTEYDHQAVVLRDGEIAKVDTLSEVEALHIEQLGEMEAFTTSGGTSTAPDTLRGRVRNYEYKTIRWPGHCERMRIFKDFGFWGTDSVEVKGSSVRPVDVFCRVFGESLGKIQDVDQCVVRCVGVGVRNGVRIRQQLDIFEKQCETTGFTAMERTTGFSIAIHAIALAHGMIEPGAVRYEKALSGTYFCNQIERRGIAITVTESIV